MAEETQLRVALSLPRWLSWPPLCSQLRRLLGYFFFVCLLPARHCALNSGTHLLKNTEGHLLRTAPAPSSRYLALLAPEHYTRLQSKGFLMLL